MHPPYFSPRAAVRLLFLLPLALDCGRSEEPADVSSQFIAVAMVPAAGGSPPTSADPWSDWKWGKRPLGLSEPPESPAENPLSAEKIELGHQLFMDKRLSVDGSRSCYSCHQNELGNADGRAKALGAGDKPLARNTPMIWNVGYRKALYWDGRAASLEAQATGAWGGGNLAVGADNLPAKAKEIGALPEYRERFAAIFSLKEEDAVTPQQVVAVLSAYERTLLCGDTKFDQGELDESAGRGRELFFGKATCVTCHSGAEFTDDSYHGIGVGFDDGGAPAGEPDPGRGKISNNEGDQYKFRTPSLRNVARTAPYFHDGSAATLDDAVRFMARGGSEKAPNHDPLLRNADLNDAEVGELVSFLESLTCPGELEVIGDQTVAGISSGPESGSE